MPWMYPAAMSIPLDTRNWPFPRPRSRAGGGKGFKKLDYPEVEAIFNPGHPIPAILEILKAQDISLIVLGTQGKGFIKEIFLGSVAHTVARLAPCPVLLIPTSRE